MPFLTVSMIEDSRRLMNSSQNSNDRFLEFAIEKEKDLEQSYAVYAQSLVPPESQTIESAFIRVIPV